MENEDVSPVSNLDQPTFEQCALASGLLTQQQVDEARAGVRWSEGDEPDLNVPPSDGQLADRLVEMGLLNAWQAKQLLDGRTKFNLGFYLIVDSIGRGGMGQVFKARHEKIGRVVAVKVLPRDKSTPEAIANFTHEIRAMASLDHPRLVRALDAGEDGNVHYLVTEYVPGLDLRKLVRRDGPLSMSAAASIICQVAEGLEYAHAQGVVHRDVKPGNVLVSPEGEAKLSDLGLSGPLAGEAGTDPRHGKIVGTADYVSPDHIRNPWRPASAWDIYSLGCTLYYAVTGKVPFPGGTTSDKARAHLELRPLDPRRLNPNLSPEFVEIMADMMAKDPAHRIASAREVIVRLTPFVSKQPGSASATFVSVASPPIRAMGQPMFVLPAPPIATPTTVLRRVIAPPMATAPLAVPPPLAAMRRPTSSAGLADTRTDFAAEPTAAINQESSSSEVVETFEPTADTDNDDSPSLEIQIPVSSNLMAVLWPLTVFFLAPLALIGAVSLLWLLARAVL